MSSSDLALSFSTIYKQISDTLGMGTSPAGDNLTKVKNIAYRGYRRFLLPVYARNGRFHVWSWLKMSGVITTAVDQWEYSLPLDFAHFWMFPAWGGDTRYVSPEPTTMFNIRKMRSMSSSTGHPGYWSLSTEKYDVDSGTRYSMALHSPPDAVYKLHYGYVIEPDKPTGDDQYFIGGALASEAILEHALAVAEEQEDDKQSVHATIAEKLTHALIERDLKLVPVKLGKNLDKYNISSDPALAQALRYVGPLTSAYGVS